MKRLLLIYFVLLNLLNFSAMAQNRTVSGRVTSATDGSALTGVSVVVKGTTIGASTDIDGRYQVSVTGSPTLVFTYIGYTTREVPVGNNTTVNVQLVEDVRALGEVVVVGYGTQEKRDVTGSIASIKAEDIQRTPSPSFETALQGRTAGVQIEQQNGKLGQGIKVRVRGSSSVSAGNEPLYVIDGIPLTNAVPNSNGTSTNPLADLNPNDIASIEVLKDASASAIYGSRAANGVVLITTKRGATGATKFNINAYVGVSKPTNRRDFLNGSQYIELLTEAAQNTDDLYFDGDPVYVPYIEGRLRFFAAGQDPSTVDTDWQDQVFQNGSINQIDVSASGGNEKTRFYAGLSQGNQEGILIKNKFEKLSGRLNLDHQATEKLSFGLNFNLTRTVNNRVSNDNAFSTPMQIVALPPITPVIDPRTNQISGAFDPSRGVPNSNFPVYYNPLLNAIDASFVTTTYRNLSNVYGSYKLLAGLTFKSEFGLDVLNQRENAYYGRLTARNIGTPNGLGVNTYAQIVNYTTNNFFNYNTTLADVHTLDVVAGMSYQEANQDDNTITGQQFPSNAYKELTSAAVVTNAASFATDYSFLSYFARANYKFKDRYLVGLSGRVDGSSRFGKNNRYGFFPAASLGWILNEESFLQNVSALSLLKLRTSYGVTGNAEVSNFPSLGLYSAAPYGGVAGQVPSQFANPDLKWEETAQFDIGVDFGFFNNRITGEFDYYIKKTSDLLLNVNLPGTSGYRTQLRNIGKLENKGVEFTLNTENLVGDFQWSTNFNFSRNRNKITDLQGQIIEGGYVNRAVEGEPIGVFFTKEYAGVDPENGDALYFLNTVNGDGTINRGTTNNYNEAERVVVGNPNPDFIAGITNNLSFKGFDLSVLFQGVFGNDIFNGGGAYMSANGDYFDNQTIDQLNRWQKPGDITDVPQARLFGGNGTGNSSRYLSDGSYVRMKNVTFGYTLPQTFTSRFKVEKFRIYAIGQNLLTFTDYEGWDPEVNTDYLAGNISQGNDFYGAPQAKTVTIGVSIGF